MADKLFPLNITDKNGEPLFGGDKVQIVNGSNSGKVLYKIRAAAKAYTIIGDLSEKPEDKSTLQIACKKVMRLSK